MLRVWCFKHVVLRCCVCLLLYMVCTHIFYNDRAVHIYGSLLHFYPGASCRHHCCSLDRRSGCRLSTHCIVGSQQRGCWPCTLHCQHRSWAQQLPLLLPIKGPIGVTYGCAALEKDGGGQKGLLLFLSIQAHSTGFGSTTIWLVNV